jgi:Copper chaperone
MTTDNKTISILRINGMKCHNCAGRVEKELRLLTGVYDVTVDLEAKTATVTYNAAQVNPVSMASVIENLGHGYEVINK